MAAQSEYERVLLAWTNGSAFFSLDINARESLLGWKGDHLSRGNTKIQKDTIQRVRMGSVSEKPFFFSKRHVPGKKSQ